MGYESPALDEYVSNLPAKLRKEAEKFVGDALDANSTEDTFRLATKIRRRMGKLSKDNEGDDGSSGTQRQQQQGQQSGDAQGQGQGKSQEQGDEQGQGDAQGQGDEGDDAQQQQGQEQQQQGTSTQDRMERAEGVANDISAAHRTHAVGRSIDRRMANTFVGYMEFHEYIVEQVDLHPKIKSLAGACVKGWSQPAWHMDYSNLLAQMSGDTSARQYSARLARLLLAREDKRFVGGQLDGRVDRRRLAQLVAGQRNVFTHQETLRTDDTIVTVAVDSSGSMEVFKTRKALALLNECLGKANVDYEILSWTGYNRAFLQHQWGGKPCPFNSNGLVELKNTTQRGNNPQVRKNIANFLEQDGWTPTFAAMQAVAHRSVKQSQTRRIVLFLTDGDPDGDRLEQVEVGKVVNAMTEVGIETIGVGIGDDVSQRGMGRMFGDSKIAVSDESQLGVSLLGQIEKMLVGRSHEAA
jgi:cobalamin biosynthesis protein CobT